MQRVAVDFRCYVTTQKIANTKLAAKVEDLSRNGVRFSIDSATAAWKPFQPGDETSIEVVLPAEHDLGERCIYGRGQVLRVSGNGSGPTSVAVKFSHADFRQLDRSGVPANLKLSTELEM